MTLAILPYPGVPVPVDIQVIIYAGAAGGKCQGLCKRMPCYLTLHGQAFKAGDDCVRHNAHRGFGRRAETSFVVEEPAHLAHGVIASRRGEFTPVFRFKNKAFNGSPFT